jgi:flagellar hook protein FlgE
MLRSLSSGVSGLKSHQTQMDVIGNNIANVNTYGFKSSRVTFRDVYYQTLTAASAASGNMGGSNASQIGYGSQIGSIDVLNTRSGFASTGLGTDCYIDGEGYFVVKDGAGNERLTQVGTFGFDGSGNLVDGNGGFVCGYPVASKSEKASVGGATIDFGTANGKALDGYTVKVEYGGTSAGDNKVTADSSTKTITVTLFQDTASTPPKPTQAELKTALQAMTDTSWTGTPPTTDGLALASDKSNAIDYSKITVDGVGATTDSTDDELVSATTGMAGEVAKFDTTTPEKIINTYGELNNCTIGTDGTITGQDKNGTIQIIGQIALANVPNPSALTLEGNSYYKAVNNTGTISYNAPGADTLGKLKTGGLESSNVDLATEFSDMIMTQRGFQANSKIITVSDEMLETLVNLKR